MFITKWMLGIVWKCGVGGLWVGVGAAFWPAANTRWVAVFHCNKLIRHTNHITRGSYYARVAWGYTRAQQNFVYISYTKASWVQNSGFWKTRHTERRRYPTACKLCIIMMPMIVPSKTGSIDPSKDVKNASDWVSLTGFIFPGRSAFEAQIHHFIPVFSTLYDSQLIFSTASTQLTTILRS